MPNKISKLLNRASEREVLNYLRRSLPVYNDGVIEIVKTFTSPEGGGTYHIDLTEYATKYDLRSIEYKFENTNNYFEFGFGDMDGTFQNYTNFQYLGYAGTTTAGNAYKVNTNSINVPAHPRYLCGWTDLPTFSFKITLEPSDNTANPSESDVLGSLTTLGVFESPYLSSGVYANNPTNNRIVANYRAAFSSIGLVLDNKGELPDGGGGDKQGTIEYIYINTPTDGYSKVFSFSCYTLSNPFYINSYHDLVLTTQNNTNKVRVALGGTFTNEFTLAKTNVLNKLNLGNVPTHADNTAATAAGLVIGDVYRTATGALMVRF